jgi:hypothetical protein
MATALGLSPNERTVFLASNLAGAGSDPTATSYYRLWDAANKELNGLSLTERWNDNGSSVTSSSPYLTTEYYNDGWTVNGQVIQYYGGCIGCSYLAVHGEAHFVYLPMPEFNNVTDDYITADGNGGYSNCYQSWYWAVGFPGWHTQTWCAWGAP